MKLQILFILLDLLTLISIPIVFLLERLRKPKK